MPIDDYRDWENLLSAVLADAGEPSQDLISVDRNALKEISNDLSRLVYATDRRFQDTADRLIYEQRERFRQELIVMNNIRIRLNTIMRDAT